jgi:hypothetical protein
MNGVKEGRRDTELFRLASWLRGEEFPQDEAEEILLLAASHCDPEFDEAEALNSTAVCCAPRPRAGTRLSLRWSQA